MLAGIHPWLVAKLFAELIKFTFPINISVRRD